jgi:hypothetical protein
MVVSHELRRTRPALDRDLLVPLPPELVTGLAMAIDKAVDVFQLDLGHALIPIAALAVDGIIPPLRRRPYVDPQEFGFWGVLDVTNREAGCLHRINEPCHLCGSQVQGAVAHMQPLWVFGAFKAFVPQIRFWRCIFSFENPQLKKCNQINMIKYSKLVGGGFNAFVNISCHAYVNKTK